MKRSIRLFCTFILALTVASFVEANNLTIQVSPQKLILSSHGGKFTIHTNTPYLQTGNSVEVTIDGHILTMNVFADDRGNLVAQCSREQAINAIDDFAGTWSSALVEMVANDKHGSQTILVKK